MQTSRSEFFLRKDYGFVDLGLNGLLDLKMLVVYEVLRRFVWRTDDIGHPEMRVLVREGYLCARISQSTVGTYVQLSRKAVNEHIATLRRLGWIKVVILTDQAGARAYVLGETVPDTHGRRHEIYYADGMLRDLWDAVDAEAKARQGPLATPLTAFTIEERIELVSGLLRGFQSPVGEEDSPLGREGFPPGGCPPQVTPPVTPGGHPLSPAGDTPCNPQVTQEVDNREKEDKGSREWGNAPSATADPFGEGPPLPTVKRGSLGSTVKGRVSSWEPVVVQQALSTAELMQERRAEEMQRREDLITASHAKDSKISNLKGKAAPVSQRKAIDQIEQLWRSLYAQHFPDMKIAFWERNGKERKSIESLISKYDGSTTELALTYAVERWDNLRERRFKGVTLPSLGLIVAAHETVFAEAQQYAQAMKIVLETKAIWTTGGMTAVLSETQQAQYDRALKDLKVMGYEV